MMKKMIAILLTCMLLLGGAAMADRERVITVMGAEETVTEYEFISEHGYSMWVDGAHFTHGDGFGEDMDVFTEVVTDPDDYEKLLILIAPRDIPNDQGGTYILEAVASYPEDMVSDVSYVELESGLKYHVVSAHDKGINYIFYTVEGDSGLLCISVAYPILMEEEYSDRVNAMINTIRILKAETEYVSEAGFTLTFNESIVKADVFADTEHDYFVPAATAEGEAPAASLLLVKSDVAWDDAEGFLGEAVAMYPAENVSDVQRSAGSAEYMYRTAAEDGMVYCFYAVKADAGIICGTAVYPETDADGYADIFGEMIASIKF